MKVELKPDGHVDLMLGDTVVACLEALEAERLAQEILFRIDLFYLATAVGRRVAPPNPRHEPTFIPLEDGGDKQS